jgi:hypothetical protein
VNEENISEKEGDEIRRMNARGDFISWNISLYQRATAAVFSGSLLSETRVLLPENQQISGLCSLSTTRNFSLYILLSILLCLLSSDSFFFFFLFFSFFFYTTLYTYSLCIYTDNVIHNFYISYRIVLF